MNTKRETKHTPGPWEAVRNNAYWEINPVNGGFDGIPFTVGNVCASEPGNPDSGLQEANARLIAAAPELLDAIKEIVKAADGDGWNQLDASFAKARAAITKAKGAAA